MRGVLLIALAACGSSSGSTDGSTQFIRWELDGTSDTADLLALGNVSGANFAGQGQDSSGHHVAIAVKGVAVGTFAIGSTTSILYDDDSGSWAADSGGITITALTDHEIQGTFQGDLTVRTGSGSPDLQITNGAFDLSY
ncbi:MAG TPA: hypothetical protein VGM88_06975 [Kofleriaceae bacterium]|jgi:hypothetical protein